jgi:hypothetical protein
MKTTYKKHWASPTRIITTKEKKLTIPEWLGVVICSLALALIVGGIL